MDIFNLQLFADAGTLVNSTEGYVNAHTGDQIPFSGNEDLSSTMKTFYDTALLENARAELFYAQLGRKQGLPANRGKIVEWRKWNTFPHASKLVEGVIPTGQKFGQTSMTGTINQYGMYTAVTDVLELHAVDDVILGASTEMGAAFAETLDTLIRDELMTGTNVIYCDAVNPSDSNAYIRTPNARFLMTSNEASDICLLTPDMVNRAATWLKKSKAPKINGKYVAVIHPSVAYDLRKSDEWIEAHKYASVTEIFNGEIGELHGVRFIESTQAPILVGTDLCDASRYLTTASAITTSSGSSASAGTIGSYKVTVTETIDDRLVGREIIVEDATPGTIHGHTVITGIQDSTKTVFLSDNITGAASGDILLPGEGGKETKGGTQVAVYATMFFGADAFGVIDPAGGSMQMIVKPKSQVGGPLEQFSTVGGKFETATKILYQDRMVRVESCSHYSSIDVAN